MFYMLQRVKVLLLIEHKKKRLKYSLLGSDEQRIIWLSSRTPSVYLITYCLG